MVTPTSHIYVCHHQPAESFSDAVFRPIHVGKQISSHALNLPGDDSGDNISNRNKQYCELTALYWIWKNDQQADWLGLMHYRRFLNFGKHHYPIDATGCVNFDLLNNSALQKLGLNAETINDLLNKNPNLQAILPKKWSVKNAGFRSIKDHYLRADHHYAKDLDLTIQVVSELYPDDVDYLNDVLNDHEGYFTNIFILKRDLFSEYCEWLFNILFEVERRLDMTNYSIPAKRVLGYLSERLFNVFIKKVSLRPEFNFLELDRIFIKNTVTEENYITSPSAPPENSISVVIASDNNFVPHLAALIESIKSSIDNTRFLDLNVLDGGITPLNKSLLTHQFELNRQTPGKLTFIDCRNLHKDIAVHMHFSNATFYRLSLGRLLNNHKKVIYIDCDTIVLGKLDELWDYSLDGKIIAAAPDLIMKSFVSYGTVALKEAGGQPAGLYLKHYLGLGTEVDNYFQAGVIVFDLDKLRTLDIEELACRNLSERTYWFLDQDILNIHLQGQVKFIDTAWNCVNVSANIIGGLNKEWACKVKEDLAEPKIIHYAGFEAKPWNNSNAPLGFAYWYFLRKTFWYEEVTKKFQITNSVDHGLKRSRFYRLLRHLWRKCPTFIRQFLNGLAHKYVALS